MMQTMRTSMDSRSDEGRKTLQKSPGLQLKRTQSKDEDPTKIIRIALLGREKTGKTAFIALFTSGEFIEIDNPTLQSIRTKKYNLQDVTYYLEILDTGGDPEIYEQRSESWLTWPEGYILFYDITSMESYEHCAIYRKHIEKLRKSDHIPMVLVGTHADKGPRRKVSKAQAADLAKSWGCVFMEISSKTGEMVEQVFTSIVRDVRDTRLSLMENPIFGKNLPRSYSQGAILTLDRSREGSRDDLLVGGLQRSRSDDHAAELDDDSVSSDGVELRSPPLSSSLDPSSNNSSKSTSRKSSIGDTIPKVLEEMSSSKERENGSSSHSTPGGSTITFRDDIELRDTKSKKPSTLRRLTHYFQGKKTKEDASPSLLDGLDHSSLIESLLSSNSSMHSGTWTSKPFAAREWDDVENPSKDPRPLLNFAAEEKHFRFEMGNKIPEEHRQNVIERSENDVPFYRQNFLMLDHVNLLSEAAADGTFGSVGPICVSVALSPSGDDTNELKGILRTKKGDERFLVPQSLASNPADIIKYVKRKFPEISTVKLNESMEQELIQDLIKYENSQIIKNYKIGLLYVKAGQTDEDEMFANNEPSQQFEDFLNFLGQKVQLEGWDRYRAGLDVKYNSTGTHSIYTKHGDFEIMFHVAPMLPYQPDDKQHVERKRHIGNDITVLIFKDGDPPFDPRILTSHFNHAFCVVEPVKTNDKEVEYKFQVANKEGVPPYGPYIPDPPFFKKDQEFRNFLLNKLINSERASMDAPVFKTKVGRTRKELLQEICTKYTRKLHRKKADSLTSVDRAVLAKGDPEFVEKKRSKKSNIKKSGDVSARQYANQVLASGKKLDELVLQNPKNFDGAEFLLSLNQLVQTTLTEAHVMSNLEHRNLVTEHAKNLIGIAAHFLYLQEERKKDEKFSEDCERVKANLREALTKMFLTIDGAAKQQEMMSKRPTSSDTSSEEKEKRRVEENRRRFEKETVHKHPTKQRLDKRAISFEGSSLGQVSEDSNGEEDKREDVSSEDLLTLRKSIKQAEILVASLVDLLGMPVIDDNQLSQVLKSLGKTSRSVYELAGDSLQHEMLKAITDHTQTMLKQGLRLKNDPSFDTTLNRAELNEVTASLLQVMKEVAVQQELVRMMA
eukprot:TRINITY_DN2782_c0_g2_i1.p1 TRINITY_DN2782_c0_g2~~TRINITY_DN2782_c0_g2_i1.p1  ORF type:complete len:1124 (-),score=330.52 TRINITY_DN2782_c0_g2_i1:6-3377(-)